MLPKNQDEDHLEIEHEMGLNSFSSLLIHTLTNYTERTTNRRTVAEDSKHPVLLKLQYFA